MFFSPVGLENRNTGEKSRRCEKELEYYCYFISSERWPNIDTPTRVDSRHCHPVHRLHRRPFPPRWSG